MEELYNLDMYIERSVLQFSPLEHANIPESTGTCNFTYVGAKLSFQLGSCGLD